MAKSRMVLIAALLLAAAPVGAQMAPADALVERQRAELREALRLDCPQSGNASEVIVCGIREPDQRERLPPIAPPRGPADRAGGEQHAAMAAGSETCTTVGRDQRCTRGLDMIGIGFAVARAIGQALANRD